MALIIGTILLEVPASFGTSDALYYFLFGTMLNVPRFLVLGIVVGYLYKRLNERAAVSDDAQERKQALEPT